MLWKFARIKFYMPVLIHSSCYYVRTIHNDMDIHEVINLTDTTYIFLDVFIAMYKFLILYSIIYTNLANYAI